MNHDSYHIPANYTDAGRLMGLFAIRNTIEAALLAVPLCYLCFVFLPFDLTTKIIVAMVLTIPTGGFALIGINDDCLTRFLATWWRWRLGRHILTFRGSPTPKEARENQWT